jgi:hypothetical protein|nr:MAG TPA: YopX protein [Caudoviricetes sp.]
MYREILFRGKSINKGKWLYGNIQIPKPPHNKYYMWDKGWQTQIDENTVGQYTGLKDKNGRKIFEGDILDYTIFDIFCEDHQYKGVVRWADDCFICDSSDGANGLAYVVKSSIEFKVIGNKFDNPKLIE